MAELNELRQVLQSLARERDDLKCRNEELTDRLTEATNDLQEIREICKENKVVVSVLEKEYRQIKREYNEMYERSARERDQRKKCYDDLRNLDEANRKLKHCLEKSYKDNEQLKHLFKQYADETRNFKSGIEQLRAAKLALEQQNEVLSMKLNCTGKPKFGSSPAQPMKRPQIRALPIAVNNAKKNQKFANITCRLQEKLAKVERENASLSRQITAMKTRDQSATLRSKCVKPNKLRMRSYPFRSSSQRSFCCQRRTRSSLRKPHVRYAFEKPPRFELPRLMPSMSCPDRNRPSAGWQGPQGDNFCSRENLTKCVSFVSANHVNRFAQAQSQCNRPLSGSRSKSLGSVPMVRREISPLGFSPPFPVRKRRITRRKMCRIM